MPAPLTNSAPASECDRQKKHSDKHHIFAPTAGVRRTIFAKLCMVIELVKAIKKVPFIFDPTHSFSYRVYGKIWPN